MDRKRLLPIEAWVAIAVAKGENPRHLSWVWAIGIRPYRFPGIHGVSVDSVDQHDAVIESEMVADKWTMLGCSLETRIHIGIRARLEGIKSEDVGTEVRYHHGAWYSRICDREICDGQVVVTANLEE